jgi:hypothetical protein
MIGTLVMNPVFCLLLVVTTEILPQVANPAPPMPGTPAAAGVYYRQNPGTWVKLEPTEAVSSKIKGMERYMQTDGLSGLEMSFVYQGPHAPMQVPDQRPTFYIRGVGSPQDALIVQLTQQKDSRVVQTESSAVGVGNKGGFNRREIRKATPIPFTDGSFLVIPEEDLKPGEYLLVFDSPRAGFDFGIRPAGR